MIVGIVPFILTPLITILTNPWWICIALQPDIHQQQCNLPGK